MSIIERYILAVTERLPEEMRYDVAEELRSNIEDMLPENAAEDEIRSVLEKLGNPRKLAQEYNPGKRFLIGPALYDNYISVLKTVVAIAIPVLMCLSLLDWFNKDTSAEIGKVWAGLFSNAIGSALEGGLQAAFWVTLVFVIIERSGVNENELPFARKKWSIDELPTSPVPKKALISRADPIVSMFLTILFTSLIYLKPQLIAVYINDPGRSEAIRLFDNDRLKLFIPAILLLALFQLCIAVWKFIQMRWTLPLAVANAVQDVGSALLFIIMCNDRLLFNPDFFEKLSQWLKLPLDTTIDKWFTGMQAASVIFIVICAINIIFTLRKCKR
ncbi:hypothetical protein CLHUN_17310 [Ruminiclostridium hungatei]|uniref:Uncharacterized protein n=1 Tax=Ruminiclostridium hungatei TaxID=48256 RepID=A0A1V4SKL5_RUMHU|nr:hypothetical protein [Ruminiclostridium hungatei]OPX44432.1 hypothetical protein CLHUN_17310 [Ruminiclostridium hungatei]